MMPTKSKAQIKEELEECLRLAKAGKELNRSQIIKLLRGGHHCVKAFNRWRTCGHPIPSLIGASLRRAKLCGADLHELDLRDANLEGSALDGANLAETNLEDAKLCNTILTSTNLTEACLYGADMRGSILFRANLTGVSINSNTKLSGTNFFEATMNQKTLEWFIVAHRRAMVHMGKSIKLMPS